MQPQKHKLTSTSTLLLAGCTSVYVRNMRMPGRMNHITVYWHRQALLYCFIQAGHHDILLLSSLGLLIITLLVETISKLVRIGTEGPEHVQRLLDSGVKRCCPNKLPKDNVNALFCNRLSARDGTQGPEVCGNKPQR